MENEGSQEQGVPPAASNNPPPILSDPSLVRPAPPPRASVVRTEKPRSGGFGWKVATLLLACLVVVLCFSQAVTWISSFGAPVGMGIGHGKKQFHEALYRDNHSSQKILLIDLFGIIMDATLDAHGRTHVSWIKDQLERAGEDDAVKGVILRVDSPGGEVLASDDIYRAIEGFQQRTGKPVIASMGGVAASGGYYVSAPCQWIVANELTMTGSIGVIMHTYNYRGLMDKVGVRPEVFKSGRFKDMLSGDKPEVSAEEREMMQAMINETFGRFKEVVREGRQRAGRLNKTKGKALAGDWQDYADGRIFSGKQAFDLGFVDELGDFDDAVERATQLAGIERANLIRYQLEYDFADFLQMFGKSDVGKVKIDLGVDLPKLQAGRLYFWRLHLRVDPGFTQEPGFDWMGPMERQRVTLGHSPDPDDAFMFYALAKERVDCRGYRFEHLLQDIQTLNERATRGELDISAISIHAYAYVSGEYALLPSGASMGDGYGPMVVARRAFSKEELAGRTIAVPGRMTSAFLALQLWLGKPASEIRHVVIPFDRIFDAVERGEADTGLIIHEGQLTFRDRGLELCEDLGVWWGRENEGLPLPLGGNVVHKRFEPRVRSEFAQILEASIRFGLDHRREAVDHALAFARDMGRDLADQFVGMYVNHWTLDYGDPGRESIRRFLGRGAELGLIPRQPELEFVQG